MPGPVLGARNTELNKKRQKCLTWEGWGCIQVGSKRCKENTQSTAWGEVISAPKETEPEEVKGAGTRGCDFK